MEVVLHCATEAERCRRFSKQDRGGKKDGTYVSVRQLSGIPAMLMLTRPLPESQRAALCTHANRAAEAEKVTLRRIESPQPPPADKTRKTSGLEQSER